MCERRQPALLKVPGSEIRAENRADEPCIALGIRTLGQRIVKVWAILITDQTYACSIFSRGPVISATREKNACLNGELIVQFTGTV